MTYKELNIDLLDNFPELKNKFDEETSWQDGIDTGCFITFEDVFMPFVRDQVLKDNKKIINRIFDYIENLSYSKDEYVENIFYVAILETFYSFNDLYKFAIYFKENTKKLFIESYLVQC